MNKNKLVYLIIFLSVTHCSAQKIKMVFLDSLTKNPLMGLQIFSETGSLISNTNSNGVFEFDVKLMEQAGIKRIMASNLNYFSQEYDIHKTPNTVFLAKKDYIQLLPVTINKPNATHFVLKSYYRSWQLINGKLVKYGDGLASYWIPYKKVNNMDEGIKIFHTNYRTFKIDSIKDKSKIVSISLNDGFMEARIPKRDMFQRYRNNYVFKPTGENLKDIYEDSLKVGYVIYDEYKNPTEISVKSDFEGDEALKILFWKISGKRRNVEKWIDTGSVRRPIYTLRLGKINKKDNKANDDKAIETVTEVFIDPQIYYSDKKPEKYRSFVDGDRSFYHKNYWDRELALHPLPSEIKEQLINVNENKNTY